MKNWVWALIVIVVIIVIALILYEGNYYTSPSMNQVQNLTSTVNSVYNSKTGGYILVNIQGMTLYTLSSDTPNNSTCYDGCVGIWPTLTVVSGTQPIAGSGISGTLGTISRADDGYQVTYNGKPLYTYSGDSGPGFVNGNGIYSYGGYWYAAVP